MFRNARRIAALALVAAVAGPAATASAGPYVLEDVVISSNTSEPTALLLPAVQAAREAARR